MTIIRSCRYLMRLCNQTMRVSGGISIDIKLSKQKCKNNKILYYPSHASFKPIFASITIKSNNNNALNIYLISSLMHAHLTSLQTLTEADSFLQLLYFATEQELFLAVFILKEGGAYSLPRLSYYCACAEGVA